MAGRMGFNRVIIPTVTNITPFTYRDGETYLNLLNQFKAAINELIRLRDVDSGNLSTIVDGINESIKRVVEDVDDEIARLEAWFGEIIQETHDQGVAFDPTNGTRLSSVSRVLSNVFDNTRVYAMFAADYDSMNLTASEYDALDFTARKYDLAPLSYINAEIGDFEGIN